MHRLDGEHQESRGRLSGFGTPPRAQGENWRRSHGRKRPKSSTRKRDMWGSNKSKRRPCYYCLKSMSYAQATIDHRQPLSKGGDNSRANTVLCCKKCNGDKGNLTESQFRQQRKLSQSKHGGRRAKKAG